MNQPSRITFNPKIKLILADVDHTVAETYAPAEPAMIDQLSSLLQEDRVIFFVTGGGFKRVCNRIVDSIAPHLRAKILISHCSGAEVWGFNESGRPKNEPFYTLYDDALTSRQKQKWRDIMQQIIEEFKLEIYDPMPKAEFRKQHGNDPLKVMMEDRGPQITFEIENGYDLTPEQEEALEVSVPLTHGALDLRIPIMERADTLLQNAGIPVTPRLGGMSALDFALKGVSKTSSVKRILENAETLKSVGLSPEDLTDPDHIEIWGDRFDQFRGGTDRHIQEAVDPNVRAIDFRQEDPSTFMAGYNTVLWTGKKHLQHGLLEFLEMKHVHYAR